MKKLPILLCLFFLMSFTVSDTQQNGTIYLFIVIEEDPNIGSGKDKALIKNIATKISGSIRQLDLEVIELSGAEASKERMKKEVNKLSISSNDVIWYYYSGHGINYDTWPESNEQSVPLSWVYNLLKQQNSRLTLTFYDACNYDRPIVQPEKSSGDWVTCGASYYSYLFLRSKGNLRMCSSDSEQFSYGHPKTGGIFTNTFVDALNQNKHVTWNKLLSAVKDTTTETAKDVYKTQNPKFELSSGFIDGKYYAR